jgi:AbrB family looped-hinge helix DNA binding protein
MMKHKRLGKSFHGMTTLGEKGQVVIPAEARKKMKLEKGEKLLVFSFDENMLILSKMEGLEKFASHLSEQLSEINKVINKKGK